MKTIIFDMDGTIVDSMGYWRGVVGNYLRQKGIALPMEIQHKTVAMSLEMSLSFLKEHFQLPDSVEVMHRQLGELIADFYATKVMTKPHAEEVLQYARKKGYQLALGTSTSMEYAKICLHKNHLSHYFQELFTSDCLGLPKDDIRFFTKICEKMGTTPQDTILVDDSVIALAAARKAGLRTIAVLDEYSKETWERIREENDVVVNRLSEIHL